MKLRVRINKQTSRVELHGEEPTLSELRLQVQEILLPSHGLSPETEITLSLNGAETLDDTGQTLSSCGIVSGDLICVILPQSVAVSTASPSPSVQSVSSATSQHRHPNQMAATTPSSSTESSSSSGNRAAAEAGGLRREEEEEEDAAEVNPAGGGGGATWQPMLCSEAEEGKVPLSLEVLHHGAQSRSPTDSLMVAAHLLMMETGFVPQGECKPSEMPSGWRAQDGLYRLNYGHHLCEKSLAMVIAVSMGPLLVINATVKTNEKVNSVCKLSLNPSSFVTPEWAGPSAAAVFKDLGKLSRTFKDQLVFPLIAAAREAMALPAVFGLCTLPPEVLFRVLRLLDVRSLVALSSVSRHFHNTTADPALWRHIYHRDFRDQDSSRSRDTDWKNLYKRRYKLLQDRRRDHRPFLIPPVNPFPELIIPGNPNPFSPMPFYPPGIIGGDYDVRPGLPRPRYDPIGPLPGHGPNRAGIPGRRGLGPPSRPADIRRGFI